MTHQVLQCGHNRLVRQLRRLSGFALLLAVAIMGVAQVSATQASSITALPPSPWTQFGRMCERGYENQLGVCVAVKIPPHAYLDASGDFWDCMRGYRQLDQRCSPITVPRHGHLRDFSYDKGWECDPGYHDTGDACIAVHVPANAYPSYDPYGPGRQCRRGYEALESS